MSEGPAASLRLGEGLYQSDSPAATEALGESLAALLEEGDVVILEGDLGAGKTRLAKGVARGLGAAGDVTSPTFTLLVSHAGGRLELHHLDLYRLESVEELGDAGALDVVGVDGASLVEWGGPFADALSLDRLDLTIERAPSAGAVAGAAVTIGLGAGEPARLIRARGVGPRGQALARALDDRLAEAPAP